jgi:hypothetical protein
MATWLADQIYFFEGKIEYAYGQPFCICDTDIDDAFNDDGSFRWLDCFIRLAKCTPRQAMQRRLIPRVQLIYIALRIDELKRFLKR